MLAATLCPGPAVLLTPPGAPLLQAMGGNYFLYIILGITALVVLSWLTGTI